MPYIDTKHLFKCETCRHFADGKCNTFCESGEGYSPNMNKIPTADVAPRAEVEREIFAEIKEQLRGIFDFFRQDNDIRESCAIMFAISEVDKIEKKYTDATDTNVGRKSQWISVDERLPEESCECLAASENGVIYLLQYSYRYKAFNATDDDDGDRWKLGGLTHWMPLPEPPKGV